MDRNNLNKVDDKWTFNPLKNSLEYTPAGVYG